MLDQIDAVFLDAGGVLLKPDFRKIQNLFDDLSLEEEMIDKALYPVGCNVGAGLGPGDDDNKFVYDFAISSGIPAERIRGNEERLQEIILFSEWVPRNRSEIKRAIQFLKRKNKKIVIVTNTENGLASNLLKKLEICSEDEEAETIEKVDKIIDSWVIGIHKPNPEIYKYSADQINVEITRCLHIGDSVRNDYDCAREAGAQALLFRPYEPKQNNSIQSLLDLITDDND
ncbi:HAD superfamily hydrolase (TIGR01549 family) [Paenibacillus sp. 4624]|jgi:putative hydrolase of the HAD superfamily|nr:HAD family hydrolase [Paenibacillus amylolyticus]